MITYYRLNEDHSVTPLSDPLEAYADPARDKHVAKTTVDGMLVSTVFLAMDHSFLGGPPLLFETMVFDQGGDSPWMDLHCERYSTWDEAAAGHEAVVARVRSGELGVES